MDLDIQMDGQTDRPTDRQTDRRRDRKTETRKDVYRCGFFLCDVPIRGRVLRCCALNPRNPKP